MAPRKTAIKTEETTVTLYPIQVQTITVQLRGTSSLISHRFAKRSIKEIDDKHQGKGGSNREFVNPEQRYQESLHPVPGQEGVYGFPASGFKGALVNACTYVDTFSKVFMRGAIHVMGDILPIHGEIRKRPAEMARNDTGVVDLRYRCEFTTGWIVNVPVKYNAKVMTPEQIINLFEVAGFHCGVGDWRPSSPKAKTGAHGLWEVLGYEHETA